MATKEGALFLVCRLGTELAALPVPHVSEAMRPLPVEPLAGAPEFVLGLSVVRGVATPVVDVGRLLTNRARRATRFVVVKVCERRVALAVEAVVGVLQLASDSLHALPPLLANGDRAVVEAIGTLDSELLLVLEGARLLPESTWEALEAAGAPA